MAKQNQTESVETEVTTDEAKPKRKQLSPEERVAKLEAELAAARERAEKKANKQRTELQAKRDKLADKINGLQKQLDEIDKQLETL